MRHIAIAEPAKKRLNDCELKELLQLIDAIRQQRIIASIKSVSRSGMTRRIDFYYIKDNKPVYCNPIIAKVTSTSRDKNGCLIVKGCGMDMIFAVLYAVCRVIKNKKIRHEAQQAACRYTLI